MDTCSHLNMSNGTSHWTQAQPGFELPCIERLKAFWKRENALGFFGPHHILRRSKLQFFFSIENIFNFIKLLHHTKHLKTLKIFFQKTFHNAPNIISILIRI